jgi:hypothetical protein
MNKQPQEWMTEGKAIWKHEEAIGVAESQKEAKIIADAHNAALAAEERRANDSIEENVRLMNKLAAEQELVKDCGDQIDTLQEELATERQSKNLITQDALNLKEELAAEREKVKLLMKAVEYYANGINPMTARNTLAKMKE